MSVLFFCTALSIDPEAVIDELFLVEEHSFSAALVLEEASFVEEPISPVVHSIAVFFVQHVVAFVGLPSRVTVSPRPVAVAVALDKVALVGRPVCPLVLSQSLRLTVYVLALVAISILVEFGSLSMFEAIFELPQITVSCVTKFLPFAFSY